MSQTTTCPRCNATEGIIYQGEMPAQVGEDWDTLAALWCSEGCGHEWAA